MGDGLWWVWKGFCPECLQPYELTVLVGTFPEPYKCEACREAHIHPLANIAWRGPAEANGRCGIIRAAADDTPPASAA